MAGSNIADGRLAFRTPVPATVDEVSSFLTQRHGD